MKKILCAVITAALLAAAVFFLPGGLDRLSGGEILPSPPVSLYSSLTQEEVAILPEDVDPTYDTVTPTRISLDGERMTVHGVGASLSDDGRILTVKQKGTYIFSGQLADGRVIVDVPQGRVHLVMAAADITCASGAPLYIRSSSTVRLIAAAGTENRIADGSRYVYDLPELMEPDAAVFSEGDLILCGTGSLTVEGNFRDAIHAKDNIILSDLSLAVRAVEDGVIGHDALLMRNVTVEANCGRDCLKSNHIDPAQGYVYAESGTYRLTAGNDAISAESRMLLVSGEYDLYCGGGYTVPLGLESCKGLKAKELTVMDGRYEIDSSDDAIHADGTAHILNGTLSLHSGDDAILATDLFIHGGHVYVRSAPEGIVAEEITVNGGYIDVSSQLDGINARRPLPLTDDGFHLYPDVTVSTDLTAKLTINGGTVIVRADGDALRVRGDIYARGGTLMLAGPAMSGGDPIDCEGTVSLSGLHALFLSGRASYLPHMTDIPMVEVTFSTLQTGGTPVAVCRGGELLSGGAAVLPQGYQKLVIYLPSMQDGNIYTLSLGGTATFADNGTVSSLTGDRAIGNFSIENGYASLSEGGKLFPDGYGEEDIW